MESLYDKIGDLLKETLDAGYVKPQKTAGYDFTEKLDNDKKEETHAFKENSKEQVLQKKSRKKITKELQRAYRLLEITFSATEEDVKKAYKEKLKYYHPDFHKKTKILQKVAADKTRQVIESYNLIMKYLSEE